MEEQQSFFSSNPHLNLVIEVIRKAIQDAMGPDYVKKNLATTVAGKKVNKKSTIKNVHKRDAINWIFGENTAFDFYLQFLPQINKADFQKQLKKLLT